jgi:hypothetical protein
MVYQITENWLQWVLKSTGAGLTCVRCAHHLPPSVDVGHCRTAQEQRSDGVPADGGE